jgi:hypothetical protein
VGEVEVDKAGEVSEATGDRSVEPVPGQVEVAQRGEGADARGQPAGEGVTSEGEVLERAHARERDELELPGEAEALECEADHGAVVAHHAPPRRRAAHGAVAVLGIRRRGPGPQHRVLGPVGDALLELEQPRHIVTSGAPEKQHQNKYGKSSHRRREGSTAALGLGFGEAGGGGGGGRHWRGGREMCERKAKFLEMGGDGWY